MVSIEVARAIASSKGQGWTKTHLLTTIGHQQLEIQELKQDLQQTQVELEKMQEMQDVQLNDIQDLHKQKKRKAIPNWRRE